MATKKNYETNGKEYYRISRVIDGKRKYFYGKSKGDAERKRDQYIRELEAKKYEDKLKHDTATFHDRAQEYIDDYLSESAKYAKGTITLYKSAYNCHINGTKLDKMKVKDIRPGDVQRFYNSLSVSMQTLRRINKFMSAFVNWLQLMDYSDNFMSAVELPKKEGNYRQ